MRWDVTLWYQDRDGNRRRCTTRVNGLSTTHQLVAFANAWESASQSISNARVDSAFVTTRVPLTERPATATSDVRRKLILLSRQEDLQEGYGSLVIPSPSDTLPWELTGDYAGKRIRREDLPEGHPLRVQIDSILPLLVRPDNLPMPTDDWVIGLMSD